MEHKAFKGHVMRTSCDVLEINKGICSDQKGARGSQKEPFEPVGRKLKGPISLGRPLSPSPKTHKVLLCIESTCENPV